MIPIVKACGKDPLKRSDVDNKTLCQYLKKMPCFSQLSLVNSEKDMLRLVSSVTLVCLPKYSVLYRIGELARSFYIVLTGSVQLFVANARRDVLKKKIKDGG